MPRWAWILALLGVGGTALYLRHRSKPDTRETVRDIIMHPLVFGTGAGVVNGMLAMARNKPMSVTANFVTAAVIGISEGVLVQDRTKAVETAVQSGMGAVTGMALFTRWDAQQRALIERQTAPVPAR